MPPSFYGMPEETISGNAFASHARAAATASGRGPGSSFTQAFVLLGADFTIRLIWAAFGLVSIIAVVALFWNSIFFIKLLYYLLTTSIPQYSKENQGRLRSARRKIQNIRMRMIKEGVLRKRVASWLDGALGVLTLSRFGNVRLVRRAVVMVGGDFARSPRMQYHATSLSAPGCSTTITTTLTTSVTTPTTATASSPILLCGGVAQEVVLVGYSCGNKLCEDLQVRSATSLAEAAYGGTNGPLKVDATSGLINPVEVPKILQMMLSLFGRKIGWIVGTVYRVGVQTLLLVSILLPLITVTVRRVTITQGDHRAALQREEQDVAKTVSSLLASRSAELKLNSKKKKESAATTTTKKSQTTTTTTDIGSQSTPAPIIDESDEEEDPIDLDGSDDDDDLPPPPLNKNNTTTTTTAKHQSTESDASGDNVDNGEDSSDDDDITTSEDDDEQLEDEAEEYERLARKMQEAAEAARNPQYAPKKTSLHGGGGDTSGGKATNTTTSTSSAKTTTTHIEDEIARVEEELERQESHSRQKNKKEEEALVSIVEICITSVILCQTPPAIPMLPLLQTLVRAWSPIVTAFRTLPVRMMTLGTGMTGGNNIETTTTTLPDDDVVELDDNDNESKKNESGLKTKSGKKATDSKKNKNSKQRPEALIYMIRAVNMRPQLVIDWHNMGYTLLEIDNRPKWMVDIYRLAEKFYGRGDHLLTVSAAMKKEMTRIVDRDDGEKKNKSTKNSVTRENVSSSTKRQPCGFEFPANKITVLHDCAPSFFAPCSREEFLLEVVPEFPPEDVPEWVLKQQPSSSSSSASHTSKKDSSDFSTSQPQRGRIVVSATSWTADDDYTMVLDALCTVYDDIHSRVMKFPDAPPPARLWVVITGKGASKEKFDNQLQTIEKYKTRFIDAVKNKKNNYIQISTIYFQSFAKYAKMLGGSDAGLSLHDSSSGYDLPMKAVDMFGAGIPVMALYYPAITELVQDGKSGWLFEDAIELADVILDDILGLPPADVEEDDEHDGNNNDSGNATAAFISEKLGLDMKNPTVADAVYWERSCTLLTRLHAFVEKNQSKKWAESWEELAQPVMQRLTAIRTLDIIAASSSQ